MHPRDVRGDARTVTAARILRTENTDRIVPNCDPVLPQRDAFVRFFLDLHFQGVLANEIFWGLWLFPFGLLVYRSRFLPRILGVWLMLACFGYLALSFTGFLFPQYQDTVWKIASPITAGELAIMLWLLIMGAKPRELTVASSAR